MRSAVLRTSVVSALVVVGCGSHASTGGGGWGPGGSVVTVSARPEGDCTDLGVVVGHAGGFGGALRSNRALIESAIDDARAQAVRSGATHFLLDETQLGDHDGTTTTATVTGAMFQCASEEAGLPTRVARPPETGDEEHVHAAVSARSEAILACVPGLSEILVEVSFGASGILERVLAGVQTSDQGECVRQVIAGIDAGPLSERTTVEVMLPPAASTGTPAEQPPSAAGADAQLRSLLDARADDILTCVGAERVALRVDTSSGALRVSLQGPMAGSPEEACVGSLLTGLAVPSGASPIVVHVVRRQ